MTGGLGPSPPVAGTRCGHCNTRSDKEHDGSPDKDNCQIDRSEGRR